VTLTAGRSCLSSVSLAKNADRQARQVRKPSDQRGTGTQSSGSPERLESDAWKSVPVVKTQ
jgi:hypothetical protein